MSNQKELDPGQVLYDMVSIGWYSLEKMELTAKFRIDVDQMNNGAKLPLQGKVFPQLELILVGNQLPVKKEDWERKFIDFIMLAQVPQRLEDSKGGVYYANKFSEAGLKVFKKALESGVIEEVLVKSVMLYYKSSIKLKKAVGNYFSQGDWRTDYEALLSSAEDGKVKEHIQNEIKPSDGERSNYSIG